MNKRNDKDARGKKTMERGFILFFSFANVAFKKIKLN